MNYYLNIGTNIGKRRDNLYRAVVAIAKRVGCCAVSRVVESDPWGFESENRFMNLGVWVRSDIQPLEMLDLLHDIERQLGSEAHRDAEGNYIDRLVDIDIMAIDSQVIDFPTLQVPHTHMAERDFFLAPMAELAPTWKHPVNGLTARQMLDKLKN